jgi:hypothetical protein
MNRTKMRCPVLYINSGHFAVYWTDVTAREIDSTVTFWGLGDGEQGLEAAQYPSALWRRTARRLSSFLRKRQIIERGHFTRLAMWRVITFCTCLMTINYYYCHYWYFYLLFSFLDSFLWSRAPIRLNCHNSRYPMMPKVFQNFTIGALLRIEVVDLWEQIDELRQSGHFTSLVRIRWNDRISVLTNVMLEVFVACCVPAVPVLVS